MHAHLTHFDPAIRRWIHVHPRPIPRLNQITHRIQRDRFKEHNNPLLFSGKAVRLAQHQRGISPG